MPRLAAVLIALCLAGPVLAQGNARGDAMRALDRAEAELRDAITRTEEGRMPAASAASRLRQALSEVERAMMQLPGEARGGPAWQTAVKELTRAQVTLREEPAQPEVARQAAQGVLGALPALRGDDTATGSS
jgi:uncharacterized protein HemX